MPNSQAFLKCSQMGKGFLSSIIDNNKPRKVGKNEKQTYAHTLSFLGGKAKLCSALSG